MAPRHNAGFQKPAEWIKGREANLRCIEILVALKRESLVRVIEHLVDNDPDMDVTRYANSREHLGQYILKTRPDIVIVDSHFLGAGLAVSVKERQFPKVILVCGFDEPWGAVTVRGIDAYVMDENLVEKLPATIRSLSLKARSGAIRKAVNKEMS